MRTFLYNAFKIGLIVVIILYSLALPIVIVALWNVPFAKSIFPFIEISVEFPIKIVAGFTAVLAWATILLAFFTFRTIENSSNRDKINRNERLLNEVIQWAISVWRLHSDLYSLTESVRLHMQEVSYRNFNDLHSDVMNLRDNGKYISKIAIVARQSVGEDAEKLYTELTKIASLLDNVRIYNEIDGSGVTFITTLDAFMKDTDTNRDTVERHLEELASLCNSIINNVAQAKLDILNKQA